jgi:hypothetical protein
MHMCIFEISNHLQQWDILLLRCVIVAECSISLFFRFVAEFDFLDFYCWLKFQQNEAANSKNHLIYLQNASIVTASQELKAKPGSTAAQESSTFYRIEYKPWSISSAARKWQNTAETAETAVLKEKSCLWNPKSWALNVEKRIYDRIWIWYFEIPKNRILYP